MKRVMLAAVVAVLSFAAFADVIDVPLDGDIVAAVESAKSGDIVRLAEGRYRPTEPVAIPVGVTLRGAGRDKTIIDGNRQNFQAFLLSDAESVVEKLTICNFVRSVSQSPAVNNSGLVNMTAGTLSDVVISNNSESAGNVCGIAVTLRGGGRVVNCLIQDNRMNNGSGSSFGAGVYMTGGSVEDSTFIGNTMSHWGDRGGGIYATGGTISRCYFSGNGGNNAGSAPFNTAQWNGGCGFYLDGPATADSCVVVSNRADGIFINGGVVKNTVVTGNKTSAASASWSAGVHLMKGALLNCTIYGNSASCEGCGLRMDAGVARNNIIYDNGSLADVSVAAGCTFDHNIVDVLPSVGSDNLATNPLLKSPETLDFSLTSSSPALNAGATLDEVSVDIVGTSRPQGDACDIGAYELELKEGEIVCSIVVLQSDWPYRTKPRVSSQVVGAPDGAVLSYKWYIDGAEVLGETGSSVQFRDLLACGAHDVTLIVTVGGVEQTPVEKIGAINVRPTEVFVATDGGDISPYECAEHAARSLDAALKAVWLAADVTGVVHVAAGDYAIAEPIIFQTPCQLLGAGREATKIDASAASQTSSGLTMGEGSVVRGLTFYGKTSQANGAGFNMTGGLVDNVCISNITQKNDSAAGVGVYMTGGVMTNSVVCKTTSAKCSGGGVYMTGGIVTDCAFFGNRGTHYGYRGGGVYMTGGTIRRCDVRDCGSTDWYGYVAWCGGAGLCLEGPSALAEQCTIVSNLVNGVYLSNGTLRNSLIYGNGFVPVSSGADARVKAGGGVHLFGGNLYNCTVLYNTNLLAAAKSDIVIEGGTAKNNIGLIVDGTSATSADNCFGEDPSFKDAAAYDFHLTSRSTNCIKKGGRLDYSTDTRDLDGKPRYRAGRVDLGCYAFTPGFVLYLR